MADLKSPEDEPKKCKADRDFSQPWMAGWLEAAEVSGDVLGELRAADVGLTRYANARRRDPLFDAACTELDSALLASVRDSLATRAAGGDVRALEVLQSFDANTDTDAPDSPRAAADAARWPVWLAAVGEGVPDLPGAPVCAGCGQVATLDPDPAVRFYAGWTFGPPSGEPDRTVDVLPPTPTADADSLQIPARPTAGQPDEPPPPTAYSQPWMADWLARADVDGDIRAALRSQGIAATAYRRGRKADPAFDAACCNLEEAIRQSATIALLAKAAAGDVRAARKLAELVKLDVPTEPPWRQDSPADWMPLWLVDQLLRAVGIDAPDDIDEPVYCRWCHEAGRMPPPVQHYPYPYRTGYIGGRAYHFGRGLWDRPGIEWAAEPPQMHPRTSSSDGAEATG